MYLLDEIFTNTVRSSGKSFKTCSCTFCTFIPNNDNVMLYNGVTCDPRLQRSNFERRLLVLNRIKNYFF